MISVIMPAYNVENYITKAIRSVLNQTYRDIQLIVVNDCSTDKTETIAKELIKNDPRALLVKTEKNVGVGGARAVGYEYATGDYIILADADDWYDLDYFQNMYNAAVKNNADMVSSGITIIDELGGIHVEPEEAGVYEGDDKLKHVWANGKITYTCNKLIKRWLFEKVPIKPRRYIEDTPVTVPQIFYANIVAVINNNGFYHRLNYDSICHRATKIEDFLYRTLCWCELVEFFLKEAPHYVYNSNLLATVTADLDVLNGLPFTAEEFEKYNQLWAEVTYKLFRYVKITQIDFKI
jgi:glycosyltransferase involved in cell wall biosynthesis